MTGLYLVVAAGHETRNSVGGGCVLWDWWDQCIAGVLLVNQMIFNRAAQEYLWISSSGRCC